MRSKEKDLQGFHKRGIGRGIIPRGWKTKAEEDSLIKNNNIRKDIKKVYKVIFRLSDDVVEHEEYNKPFEAEEDIKEYLCSVS